MPAVLDVEPSRETSPTVEATDVETVQDAIQHSSPEESLSEGAGVTLAESPAASAKSAHSVVDEGQNAETEAAIETVEGDTVAELPAADETSDFNDFDDFDDFDDFEEGPVASESVPPAAAPAAAAARSCPLTSADIVPGVGKKVAKMLGSPAGRRATASDEHLTATSKLLWGQLMESPQARFVDWHRSSVHRRLAVSLGVPLNLDHTLPKAETRHMSLQTKTSEEKADLASVPLWRLIAVVSREALDGMSAAELQDHIAQLQEATTNAQHLLDTLEAQESDLHGEKEVLEGMVESLLDYAQKTERAKLHNGKGKSKKKG